MSTKLVYRFLLLYLANGLLCSEIITCDNAHPCNNITTLSCKRDDLCQIICESPSICKNKKLICNKNQNCEIHCKSEESCQNVAILCGHLLCNIYGENIHSLQYAEITAMNNTILNIECSTTTTCNNAIINGELSSNTSIVSNVLNAFKDITISCPAKVNNTKRCYLINSNKYVMDQHNTLTIYAHNSWNDIDIDNYNAIANGNMFCDAGQCQMIYGLWNCKDTMNPCYVNKDKTVNKICATDKECKNEVIDCNGIDIDECNVICAGLMSCTNATINCNDVKRCNVVCSGEFSCNGLSGQFSTQINCPSTNSLHNGECQIICGTPTNSGSCYRSIIHGNNSDLHIYSIGLHGISRSMIYCGNNKQCNILCNQYASCQEIEIYALNASDMKLICDYPCVNPTIYCPTITNGTKHCLFYGTGADTHTDLNLFCINSWADINMNIINHMIVHGIMHCTESLDKTCTINNNTQCICPPYPTAIPTAYPFEVTITNATRHDPSTGLDSVSKGLLIAFGAAFILILVGWVSWYCICRPSDDIYTQTIHDADNETSKYDSSQTALTTINERQRLNT